VSLALLLAGFAACGGQSTDLTSTDTGNPPVIERRGIHLRAMDGVVIVSGDAGAVAPGGARVEVRNLTRAASANTVAANDGSFEVTVAGAVTDEYEVSVSSGGRTDQVTVGEGEPSLDDLSGIGADLCTWGVDALLREVGALVVDGRLDCGVTNGAFVDRVEMLHTCFANAPTDPGAEFTVNNCTDCAIPTTYVSTPTGEYFAILMEADIFGDELREAEVVRCSSIEFAGGVNCQDREEVYSCAEPLR
jgi:hypothetical protein